MFYLEDFIGSILRAMLIASAFLLALHVGSAFGQDSPFYFDEGGNVQQRGYWSPSSPNTNRYNEQDRQAYREWSNAETLRKNRETIDDYYVTPKPTTPSSDFTPGSSFWSSGPDGRNRLCTAISPKQILCQ